MRDHELDTPIDNVSLPRRVLDPLVQPSYEDMSDLCQEFVDHSVPRGHSDLLLNGRDHLLKILSLLILGTPGYLSHDHPFLLSLEVIKKEFALLFHDHLFVLVVILDEPN